MPRSTAGEFGGREVVATGGDTGTAGARLLGCATLVSAIVIGGACHHSSGPTAPSLPSTLVFAQSPIDASAISYITPLGNLNPPGHTLPTNHIYFYHPPSAIQVVAPAAGDVMDVRHESDDALYVQGATGIIFYFGHLVLDSGIVRGTHLTAGQRLGVVSLLANALDLGVENDAITLPFVRPERYIAMTLHADSPLKYFQEPVKTTLYAKVRRTGTDKDGRIDFDQPGRLAGNWFLESLPVADTENVVNGPKHLAFVRDVEEPALVRVSIGGSLTMPGAFWVEDGTPDPADITVGTGKVSYRLFNNVLRTGTGDGLLIVQMLAVDRIQIETFPGSTASTADFTGASLFYVR